MKNRMARDSMLSSMKILVKDKPSSWLMLFMRNSGSKRYVQKLSNWTVVKLLLRQLCQRLRRLVERLKVEVRMSKKVLLPTRF